MENVTPQSPTRWHDNKVLVNLLLFLFFPVGLYALWKSRTIAMWWKVGGTALIALWVGFIFSGGPAGAGKADTPALTAAEQQQVAVESEAQQREEAEAEAKAMADNTIASTQLVAAYQENEVKADQNFKGKTFYVAGTVTDIKKDLMDDIYVTLEGDEIMSQVQCFIEDETAAASLSKGQQVTIRGRCDGLLMNVLMKDCSIVE